MMRAKAEKDQKIEFYLMAKHYGLDVKWAESTIESLRMAILESWSSRNS